MLTGDGKLVERCLQGDDAAWEAIVTTYARRIYNLGYRYTGRTDEAEDLTQEIFIKIYQNLKAFRPEAGNLLNWILKVSRNLIIDHYRQTRRFQHTAGSEEMETMNLSDEKLPDAHRLMEQSEASRFLRDGLQALSPELKEAVILRDLEGMAYQEIAQLLNVPEGTVKSRINRGRIELAKLLVKRRSQAGMQL
ncbi:MAG: RNA polymerase subunit sigma-24 [Acidobacteria bacterium]|nr:MAG: RNA polymerase subunit sigma-24 [Acidobacteriota bacterium]PYU99787.1 MAG: RNA polymerase subunit sigma-24 [Acidobacteriota bacterium]